MPESFTCQGRLLQPADISWLQSWIVDHPSWSRYRLACELCKLWDWSTPTGQLKDFAARSFLVKLMARGLITLPPVRTEKQRAHGYASPVSASVVALQQPLAITSSLAELTPLSLSIPAAGSSEEHLYHHYLSTHHYLGFQRTVGENLKYLISDHHGRHLACLLFGAAAWKTKPRDQFIGWTDAIRSRRLSAVANNNRFLILPWVRVPHLASHLLSIILRRISADWQHKYGHPLHLIETFVERDRFRGTCYLAANWKLVGQTTGRSRQDRYSTMSVPVKDIYLYPLTPRFRELLCHEDRH
ncbi:MAG: DUF4338 domain-containing protein [Proteobacteria bacterium]|nr:DUF4338 domain-containing protein [Pseudomonadota bacterium]MBU4297492.1 DUF4338 domain-containing protein [Pseudomonadota bacterium]